MLARVSEGIRLNRFAIAAGLICFAYAALAWLTVTPNQDILADGIQAQSLITDPRLVLAFPGQKHGGPLEYPYTVLAEWLFPGNYFANAAIRPLLAFATGFVVAKLFLSLFPRAPKWSLLLAMAVGPAVMHAYTGPDNAFGVIWLQPNYDMSWLLVSTGALVLSRLQDPQTPLWRRGMRGAVLAGLLLGLGFYAHPNITILLIPLVVLVVLRTPQGIGSLALVGVGGLLGVIPAAASYIVNARVNTWDPSHKPFIALDFYQSAGAAVLGLDGIPDHARAVLPYAFGLPPDQSVITGAMQSIITAVILGIMVICAGAAGVGAVRNRRRISPAGALAVSWLMVVFVLFLFITFVDAVWLYSPQLSILTWLTIGALPSLVPGQHFGIAVTVLAAAAMLLGTLSHGWQYFTHAPEGFSAKLERQEALIGLAQELEDAGVTFVYGSYLDVMPIAYASGSKLRPIANRYNRFPITDGERSQIAEAVLAVNLVPSEPWGYEALDFIKGHSSCHYRASFGNRSSMTMGVFKCPQSVLS